MDIADELRLEVTSFLDPLSTLRFFSACRTQRVALRGCDAFTSALAMSWSLPQCAIEHIGHDEHAFPGSWAFRLGLGVAREAAVAAHPCTVPSEGDLAKEFTGAPHGFCLRPGEYTAEGFTVNSFDGNRTGLVIDLLRIAPAPASDGFSISASVREGPGTLYNFEGNHVSWTGVADRGGLCISVTDDHRASPFVYEGRLSAGGLRIAGSYRWTLNNARGTFVICLRSRRELSGK